MVVSGRTLNIKPMTNQYDEHTDHLSWLLKERKKKLKEKDVPDIISVFSLMI